MLRQRWGEVGSVSRQRLGEVGSVLCQGSGEMGSVLREVALYTTAGCEDSRVEHV